MFLAYVYFTYFNRIQIKKSYNDNSPKRQRNMENNATIYYKSKTRSGINWSLLFINLLPKLTDLLNQDSSKCSSHRAIFLFLGKLKRSSWGFCSLCCSIYKLQHQETILRRSNRWQILFKIGVLKDLASATGKHLCWSLILMKLQTPPVAASDCSVFLI